MQREFNVGANVGKPQVAYRETIRNIAEADYTHKKQTGGSGQYARVKLRVEPFPGGEFEFVNEVKGGNIPKEFIPAIEKGVVEALEHEKERVSEIMVDALTNAARLSVPLEVSLSWGENWAAAKG